MGNLETQKRISKEQLFEYEIKQADKAIDEIVDPFLIDIANKIISDAEKAAWNGEGKVKDFKEYFMDENPERISKIIEKNYNELKFFFDNVYEELALVSNTHSNFGDFLEMFNKKSKFAEKKRQLAA